MVDHRAKTDGRGIRPSTNIGQKRGEHILHIDFTWVSLVQLEELSDEVALIRTSLFRPRSFKFPFAKLSLGEGTDGRHASVLFGELGEKTIQCTVELGEDADVGEVGEVVVDGGYHAGYVFAGVEEAKSLCYTDVPNNIKGITLQPMAHVHLPPRLRKLLEPLYQQVRALINEWLHLH